MTTTRGIRTAATIMFDGDDYETLTLAQMRTRLAKAEVMAAREQSGTRNGAGAPARGGDSDAVSDAELAVKLAEAAEDELIEAARHRAVEVRLRGIGRKAWRKLVAEHPPREDNEDDADAGYDQSTFPDAVVAKCLVEPKFGTEDERDEWLDELTEGESDKLFLIAFGLNRGAPSDPKVSQRSASLS